MPMSSDLRISIVFNALASGFGWAGFGVSISAITSNYWVSDGNFRYGLWNACSELVNNCSTISASPALNATRAFMILYAIFMFLGSIANIVSQCKYNKEIRSGSGGIFSIAATFGVVGAAVYSGTITQSGLTAVKYGYGFGAAWGVIGGGYLAGMFNQISARYMPETIEGECTNDNTIKLEKF